MSRSRANDWSRRDWLKAATAGAAASAVFSRAVAALAERAPEISAEMIRQAEWIAGLELSDDERQLMVRGMNETRAELAALRAVELDNGAPPAFAFLPELEPRDSRGSGRAPVVPRAAEPSQHARPAGDDELAFCSVSRLGGLLRAREVSSVELTKLYLARLDRYDPLLRCVITRTDNLALRQAERADRALASGDDQGPLHGIPWGAKDLLAVPGYPTTWGAKPFRRQVRTETAAVVERLERAGAVLVAKLSLGALAWGDVWFGGTTRNPWNPEDGSSGSSAGSASATAAGLVGFSIGSETWGSIVSPCTRCGASGLRPTFGRVSRFGAMALSWTMDKLGPIARTVDDLGSILSAIHGRDPRDPTAVDRPFSWPVDAEPETLRVGYTPALFDEVRGEGEGVAEETKEGLAEWKANDLATLEVLRGLGFELLPIELPRNYPIPPLATILTAEAATAFDRLTRSGRDAELVRQIDRAWPNVLRQGQLIPAVEYVRAQRIRRLVQEDMDEMMRAVDVYVSPSFLGDNLLLTNLTGHPQVVVPNGFRTRDGTPTSITFTGRLFGESDLLSVAAAYQSATRFHEKRPPLDRGLAGAASAAPPR